MLQVQQVSKFYHQFLALNAVSFQIPDQCISVLVGPNGAGKSTLIKSIMGLLRYQGEITLDGLSTKQAKSREKLAYVPEIPSVYDLLTVDEHLEFIARLYKIDQWRQKADDLLDRFEMLDKRKKLGSELSKGMQQKVSLCCGLLSEPSLILFDEPMMGLDPHAIKELTNVFLELKQKGCSILISTHILSSVEAFWEQAMIMQNGHLCACVQKSELEAMGQTLESYFFSVTENIHPDAVSTLREDAPSRVE